MELTLNSSSSLIKRKDAKSSRNQESSSNNMTFAKMKPPTYQFQAKNSVKEMKFTHEKTFTPEGETLEKWKKLHVLSYPHSKNDASVPVFVMQLSMPVTIRLKNLISSSKGDGRYQ